MVCWLWLIRRTPSYTAACALDPRPARVLTTEEAALAAHFAPLAKELTTNEQTIVAELQAVQGKPVDIGGYYQPELDKLDAVMRPSATFNAALASAAV